MVQSLYAPPPAAANMSSTTTTAKQAELVLPGTNSFAKLPTEITLNIFSYLSHSELFNSALVCREVSMLIFLPNDHFPLTQFPGLSKQKANILLSGTSFLQRLLSTMPSTSVTCVNPHLTTIFRLLPFQGISVQLDISHSTLHPISLPMAYSTFLPTSPPLPTCARSRSALCPTPAAPRQH